jgi:3-hydroxyisobutyrate dehydrogenase
VKAKIAFLGMGEMGRRMAGALIDANYDVAVWNRNPEKADELISKGATFASTPRAAAKDADFIFAMVRDDKASEYVWLDGADGALQDMKSEAIAIECSTLSVNHVKFLHAAFKESSLRMIEAPLAGSRPQADAKKLIFFAAGDEQDVNLVQPILLTMGGACHFCGPAGSGAAIKLMVNALFGAQVAIFAELIAFARDLQLDLKKALEIISSTPVCSPAAAIAASAMADGLYSPAFPIDLVSKDFALLALSGESTKSKLPISSAVRGVYDLGKEMGFSQSNITGIFQLYN